MRKILHGKPQGTAFKLAGMPAQLYRRQPMDDLVERFGRWLQNTGYDGDVNSPPMLIYALVQAQEAEIRSLREQVAQERAGIVAYLHREAALETPFGLDPMSALGLPLDYAASMIEAHKDKEPRS